MFEISAGNEPLNWLDCAHINTECTEFTLLNLVMIVLEHDPYRTGEKQWSEAMVDFSAVVIVITVGSL